MIRQPEELLLGADGTLVVPLSLLAEAGLDPGTTVVAYCAGDGRIVLRRSQDALAELLGDGTLT